MEYTDGTTDTVVTGPEWRTSDGPLTSAGLYEGEEYDARREQLGWSRPDFDDSAWQPARLLPDFDTSVLFPADSPPVRRIEYVEPVSVDATQPGRLLLDFGQNLVGRLRIRTRGSGRAHDHPAPCRDRVENGTLSTHSLGCDRGATDRYTLRGDATGEEGSRAFTFRRASRLRRTRRLARRVEGPVMRHRRRPAQRPAGAPAGSPVPGPRAEPAAPRTWWWGMRGNFLDVPTDSPQRDERLGWTGDVQVSQRPPPSYLCRRPGLPALLAARISPPNRQPTPAASRPS
ncbi:family 78 glycoside hydrolase catalytic domain [Streptomyces sp. L7]